MKEKLLRLKTKIQNGTVNESEKEELAAFLRNPRLETDEYYTLDNPTGYASIDRPQKKYYKKGVLEAEYPKMKMYDYLYLRRKKHLNFTALNYYGRKITYDEMFDKIEEVAKAFKQNGVKEGDYVVITMPTTPESVYMLFALNRIGAVAVEIDPRTSKEDLETTIIESKAKFIVAMEDLSPMICNMLNSNVRIANQVNKAMLVSPTISLPFGLNIASNAKDNIERAKGKKPKIVTGEKYISWHDFVRSGRGYNGLIDSQYKENDVVEIIYSSGTTNSPKPIEYTNETFTAMVRQVELSDTVYKERDKNLDIIPMFLGFGSNNGLYVLLCFGLEDILIPTPVIETLPQLIRKYKPNHMLGAPIHMKVLLNYLKNDGRGLEDLSFIKSLICGSAHLATTIQYELDDELMKRKSKSKVGPGYGQNEGGPTLSFSPHAFREERRPNCSGLPLPGTIISIFDPQTDEELKYGMNLEGEIRYKTPCSMKGYAFDKKELTEKYYKNGWCCSGDLGKIDADGGLYITGRITRQISRSGFKFSPMEIEEFVLKHIPAIESCALVGVPDDMQENLPVLYYTIKEEQCENAGIIREELIALCSSLKEYKIPYDYIEIDKLPVTKNLKVDFKTLEKQAEKDLTIPSKKRVLSNN